MSSDHPQPDPLYRIRHLVGPAIDHLAHAFGQREYVVRDEGYVGTAPETAPEFEKTLRDLGFAWDPLSLYHHTPSGRTSDASWTYRETPLVDRQLHVVLFEQADDTVDIYAHEEPSWVRHPLKHALMDDIDRSRGVARTCALFDQAAIEYQQRSLSAITPGRITDSIRAKLPVL